MPFALNAQDLSSVLPGSWIVRATNFPMWLDGERLRPRFSYELIKHSPLRLRDDVSYHTPQGEEKHIVGRDAWKGEGFTWRGNGLLTPFTSKWSVSGANDDASVLAIRFQKSLATPAGNDVIVREGHAVPELRRLIAGNTESFGLTPEEFASLTWLD